MTVGAKRASNSQRSQHRYEHPGFSTGEALAVRNTLYLHRVLTVRAAKPYPASPGPDAAVRWRPLNDFTEQAPVINPRAGRDYRLFVARFATAPGRSIHAAHEPLIPHARLRCTGTSDDPNPPAAMHVTVDPNAVSRAAEIMLTLQGVANSVPHAACDPGSLQPREPMARPVEPEIRPQVQRQYPVRRPVVT